MTLISIIERFALKPLYVSNKQKAKFLSRLRWFVRESLGFYRL